MAWTQPHNPGAGTTGEIEQAHKALDALNVKPGPLAFRVIQYTNRIAFVDEILRARHPRARWSSWWSWYCYCGYQNWRWDKFCAGRRAGTCEGRRPDKKETNG